MSFERLTSQINGLSEQVEALLQEGNEEQCPNLLSRRLALLEELTLLIEKDKSMADKYHGFLLSIQSRDSIALDIINVSKNKILSDGSHQKKRTNAVNTYHKFSE